MAFKISSLEDYHLQYRQSVEDPLSFWSEKASHFSWYQKWSDVLEYDFEKGTTKWFLNGKLNITENCIDRHLMDRGNETAVIWEPNNPQDAVRKITYSELFASVCRFANVLKQNNVCKGDRICIYMPMVPELLIAMLACARIGAVHSVVFGGFSAQSVADRIEDADCKLVITADSFWRGEKEVKLKNIVDEALRLCGKVLKVIVYQRTGNACNMMDGRDVWWHHEVKKADVICEPEIMDSEDLLFILYTSGSTGKPKGVVHTCGGYMVYTAYSFQNVFQYQPGEVFFCTADIGWVTGHSYIVYGPLLLGATVLMFEGIPTWPDASRFWQITEKHGVNILYTAPTAIRSLMSYGDDFTKGHNLSSLRVLGTVGEPINEEAWLWYHEKIGNEHCPVVDTWWQTETGGILISPLAGITPTKPSYATLPLPGVQPVLVDEKGNVIDSVRASGNLCIKFPWPSIIRTTYGDHERCRLNYFSAYPGLYFTGDGCMRDEDGYYRITGRVDDVINVSGHRIGTAEVENAINMHEDVVESAVVGYPHEIKGQGLYAFVICAKQHHNENDVKIEINEIVSKIIGAFARPDKIQFVSGLPKTRSGKIMRRILRKIAEGETENIGDVTTLLDPDVVSRISETRL